MASMRTIGVRLRLLIGDYKRDADEAAKATDKLGQSVTRTGKKGKADLDQLAMGAGIVGAALVGVAGAAIYAAAAFDKQMSEVGAVAGATAEEMAQLRQAALDAGAATVFSAKEAAQAEAELAKAGISAADILGGALSGSLSLASAGSLDLATSAEIAAAAMNTFGLEGKDVEHIADVLAAAANKSAAGVDDLGQGLQQVGLVANQVGFTLEETVGLLAAFADRGLKGSDGATSLKTALMRLAAPTDGAADVLKALNISLYDMDGNMVDAVSIAGQLQAGMKDLAPAQRNAALQTIFGSDAIRAANVLYDLGADGIRDYIDAVDDQGAAARMSAAKLNNLAGDVEALKGSLETLFISSGEGANGGLRILAKAATELVNSFAALPGPVQSGAVVIAGLVGTGLLATAAVLKLKSGLADMVENLTSTGPAGAKAGKGLQAVAHWGGRAAVALGAVAIGGRIIGEVFGEDVNADVSALAKSLAEFGKTGAASGEAARLFGDGLEDLRYDLSLFDQSGWGQFSRGFAGAMEAIGGAGPGSQSLAKATERMAALDGALAELVGSGHADQAAAAFARIAGVATEQGISVEDVTNGMSKYKAALEVAGPAAEQQAAAAAEDAASNVRLAGAFGQAANEADGLLNAYKRLNGGTLNLREAQREAEAAVDELAEALKESGGSMDITTDKGRKAAAAADSLALKAAEVAQATYDQTGSVEEANKAYAEYVEQLRQSLLNAGVATEVVDGLVASITKMPTYKAITIDVLETHRSYWQDYRAGERERWGGITEHAAAGALSTAKVFPPGPTRYAFAEPETGGEAFVPRRGNYGRSMSILSAAAGWYNADVVPRNGWYGGAGAAGGGGQVNVVMAPKAGADRSLYQAFLDATRFDVTMYGAGDVQNHMGTRGRI